LDPVTTNRRVGAGRPAAAVFRAAGADDVTDVVALVESAYRGDASREGWTTEADLLDGQRTDAGQVAEIIHRPGSLILLGLREGERVACCHLEKRTRGSAYFGMFAVRPGLQGMGIGRAVLQESCRIARGWGCTEIRMTVIRQREDLIAWYGRLGFLPTGETEPFPYGNERFGRPRRDDLEFIVLSGRLDEPNLRQEESAGIVAGPDASPEPDWDRR
jgi:GNAT superfamily N-acetyltransferase